MNLYGYLGSNPVNFGDPLGLIYDPFEDVDDIIARIWAERGRGRVAASARDWRAVADFESV